MTPEQEQALKVHLQAIAQILDDDSDPAAMKTLEGLELTVRQQIQTHVSPKLGSFLSKPLQAHEQANPADCKAPWGVSNHLKASRQTSSTTLSSMESSFSELLSALKCNGVFRASRAGCGFSDGHARPSQNSATLGTGSDLCLAHP